VGPIIRAGRSWELLAAMRCLRLAVGLPYAVSFFRLDAYEILAAFDLKVTPLICGVLSNPQYLARVLNACRVGAVKTGFAIWSYSRMAEAPFDPYLAAMAGSFSRLYDDLLDHGDDRGFDERFAAFLASGRSIAACETELLLYRCFDAIRQSLSRCPSDPIFRAVSEAHRYQCLSRIQRRTDAANEHIDAVISNKGGYGALVWFGLMRSGMTAQEATVVWQIGAVCQLLDDQHDLAIDRSNRILTGATGGWVGPLNVAREVMRLRKTLAAHYGAARARRFAGLLCILTMGLLARRHEPRLSEPETPTGPWRILKGHSYTVIPGQ
jgi:hypothetical protein